MTLLSRLRNLWRLSAATDVSASGTVTIKSPLLVSSGLTIERTQPQKLATIISLEDPLREFNDQDNTDK